MRSDRTSGSSPLVTGLRHLLTAAALAYLLAPPPALTATGADFVVPAGTAAYTFDGAAQGVMPGQIIELAAGVHGPRVFRNIVGTATQPVTIRSATSGQAIIRRSNPSNGGFVFTIRASRHFVVDGGNIATGVVGHPFGIKITYAATATANNKDSPSAFLKTLGDTAAGSQFNNCTDFVVRHVEIDGGWPTYSSDGIGISTNDHDFHSADYPGAWQQNILIEWSSVRNTEGEGFYVGPNYYTGGIPLRNIEIRHNRVENTGWDGLQVKSTIEGSNLIHHNVLRNTGSNAGSTDSAQLSGLSIMDGTAEVYNNYIERSGDTGIKHYIADAPASLGSLAIRIYNNVVVDAGVIGLLSQHGISSAGAGTGRNGGANATPRPMIYNNTIIRARGNSIRVGGSAATGSMIRDNIVADATAAAISAPPNVANANNLVAAMSTIRFVDADALDFRLTADSPAVDSAGSTYPPFDFDDVARPQDARPDRGAFEFKGSSPSAAPNPPGPLIVQ